ncbi:uncharacterized protein LOC129799876 [Phlebotomus papatasi]|uniref:uncharacterized protein LOC129799876 n=1 Tax=Phlebotomus papatasi TaxID=29031 RepID=UPI0024846DCB|nr:uncharacterized protein LOC129799876 [Phlebotomus papatasi]
MPNTNVENLFGSWMARNEGRAGSSSPKYTPFNSRHNSPVSLPSSPISTSPLSTSPPSTLRRSYSSTFTLIPEDRAVDEPIMIQQGNYRTDSHGLFFRLLLWWPIFLLKLFQLVFRKVSGFVWNPFRIAAPTFWISAGLWIFWKFVGFPLALFKWILIRLHTPSAERNRRKRTVLISGGSTIQTLHLARNFYTAGSRVVVFEFEGLFGLARFSTAVSKFYTVPCPAPDSAHEYVAALCEIVEKEKPSFYIPTSATSAAHYDALAKPHLELLGCLSFIPGAQEVSVLDDIMELMVKCRSNGIALPPHRIVQSKEDLFRLYDIGWLSGFRNIIISAGPMGILERNKFILPSNRRDLRLTYEISEQRPWMVIRDLPGSHYITCTTIKESRVVANVTCLVNSDTKSLVPECNEEVEKWLKDFFNKIRFQRPINAHVSFRLVKCDLSGNLLPMGTRVGVSLPYICYTGVHPRVLWKPCPHFSRQNSGPLVQEGGRYWMHEAVLNTLRHPSVDAVGKLIGTVLDKREALFVFWDPLPYCAYYHFQLPFNSVKQFLQKRQASRHTATTMTAPVH